MADMTTYSAFRMQAYRLAWLFVYSMLAIVVLMWMLGHNANDVLAQIGFGLFVRRVCSVFYHADLRRFWRLWVFSCFSA